MNGRIARYQHETRVIDFVQGNTYVEHQAAYGQVHLDLLGNLHPVCNQNGTIAKIKGRWCLIISMKLMTENPPEAMSIPTFQITYTHLAQL